MVMGVQPFVYNDNEFICASNENGYLDIFQLNGDFICFLHLPGLALTSLIINNSGNAGVVTTAQGKFCCFVLNMENNEVSFVLCVYTYMCGVCRLRYRQNPTKGHVGFSWKNC